ncbi:MAG: class I SAM-dependent methyltransferase [Erysipelotrichaceae bacterium]|nr:class I SAM-dependent methyltransferase [Erysipelotrichaceae bacterium]
MKRFEGVANTLFVPLVARIAISKEFPEYFKDEKALELEPYLPEGVAKGSSQYSNIASVARYYNMDRMVMAFAEKYPECNVVYLGAGLETAYDRMKEKLPGVHWYECDLPEVIEARTKVFGQREREITIAGDMFQMKWTESIDRSLPTLFVISGVFQYFHEEDIVTFIRNCRSAFPGSEMIFDATSRSGLLYTNWFIKRTGNTNALMYFGVDDSEEFARRCATILLEERTFFPNALKMLGKKLNLITRISMKIAERNKSVKILHLKLTDAK